jgi:four helix bundle protein
MGSQGSQGAQGAQGSQGASGSGSLCAFTVRMGVKRFEDLIAWQLADQLQTDIFEFTSQPPASTDFKYCDQIRDSIRSAKRNTSEGFGRYYPKEFARFLRIAAGSLQETKNHLQDGLKQQYLSAERHEQLKRLCLRAMKANVRLIAYLRHAKPPEPFDKHLEESPESPEPFEP